MEELASLYAFPELTILLMIRIIFAVYLAIKTLVYRKPLVFP